jgi:predicted nucleic acid-binding protein
LIIACSAIAQDVKTVVNDPNAELRTVANFTGIKVSGGIGVYISQGKENAVAVSCSDEKHNNKIITEVKNAEYLCRKRCMEWLELERSNC